jgi:hypothetical protein
LSSTISAADEAAVYLIHESLWSKSDGVQIWDTAAQELMSTSYPEWEA